MKRFIESQGWTLVASYSDDRISGAEFRKRPGYQKMMAALTPTPSADALIVVDRDRLGRETLEVGFTLKRLTQAGVDVYEVNAAKKGSDTRIKLTTATAKILASVEAYGGELQREQSRIKTSDAMWRRATSGHSTGGAIFGYTSVCATCQAPTTAHRTCTCKARVKRQVVEPEAAAVRQVSRWPRRA